ncbi:MAG: hypothetical protein R6V76_14215 [Desulfobacterales bacterium]
MELLTLFETVAVKDGKIYLIGHPHTGRQIKIPAADLSGILDLVPGDIIAAYKKGATGASRRAFINAILAAKLNRRLKSIWVQKDSAIWLPAEKIDPPMGYYYPEKGKTAYFEGHGRITVDPYLIVPIPRPRGIALERLEAATRQYGKDPYTSLAVIGHGAYTYLVQAKRLNGRKYLFGKLLHDGTQYLTMGHWARISGWDAGTLIRRCGLDSSSNPLKSR